MVHRLLLLCQFGFDWEDDGFACSNTMEISNLSLSLSQHENHHPDLLELAIGKGGSKQHFWCSRDEAYYLVKELLFVLVFPLRRFAVQRGAHKRTHERIMDRLL
jgi:hypothetical protein